MAMKRRYSLITQIALFFLIGILLTGALTYFTQIDIANDNVREQTEYFAAEVSDEVIRAIREYPAHFWLMRYWYVNHENLDIEYDVDYSVGTETEAKAQLLSERYPNIQLKYATVHDFLTMTDEDRKLYAEVVYSWLITRLNQIKQAYHMDFLFCCMSDRACEEQFFLLSAADPGAVRGTTYLQVYPLGTVTKVTEIQQQAMLDARDNVRELVYAGDYEDYYTYVGIIDRQYVFIGLTYNVSGLREDAKADAMQGTMVAVVQQLLLSLICLSLILFFVVFPLNKVIENIRLYKQNKDSGNIVQKLKDIHPRNEIGQLSDDIQELSIEMDDYQNNIRTITADNERVVTELGMAARIQASMLPDTFPAFPDRTEFDIHASMDPAKEVGGDFYDFFLIDEDHLCMVMADVSGKGVPAALFMMASKIILKNNAMMGKSPAEVLRDTNATICSNNRMEMFVTVWLGILEISTGRLTAANAGHEYPVLRKTAGCPFELLKDKHGFVIGGMDGMKYKEYEILLESGSKLFLYTDGVPEATDKDQQLFGNDRMLAALNSNTDAAPEEVLRNVRGAVDRFVNEAEQFDDLTMLCLEYKG